MISLKRVKKYLKKYWFIIAISVAVGILSIFFMWMMGNSNHEKGSNEVYQAKVIVTTDGSQYVGVKTIVEDTKLYLAGKGFDKCELVYIEGTDCFTVSTQEKSDIVAQTSINYVIDEMRHLLKDNASIKSIQLIGNIYTVQPVDKSPTVYIYGTLLASCILLALIIIYIMACSGKKIICKQDIRNIINGAEITVAFDKNILELVLANYDNKKLFIVECSDEIRGLINEKVGFTMNINSILNKPEILFENKDNLVFILEHEVCKTTDIKTLMHTLNALNISLQSVIYLE